MISAFVVVMIIWSGVFFIKPQNISEISMVVLFALVELYFLITAIFYSIRLIQDKPALVIDDQGIIDNTEICALGRISWKEITIIEYSGPIKGNIIKNLDRAKKVVTLASSIYGNLGSMGRVINAYKSLTEKAYILIEVKDMKKLIRRLPFFQRAICYLFLCRRCLVAIAMDYVTVDITDLAESLEYYENKHGFELYL